VTEGSFTAAQMEAITADDGPLGIIAGPGCGKTSVLAGRIAFLIRERGLDPSSVLAVSFTTEAARAARAGRPEARLSRQRRLDPHTPRAGSARHRHLGSTPRF
jgi:superfamily I DNA/RNA helicase